jgi:hypothetical protein
MDHPVFGPIQQSPDEHQWTGRVRIDFFADYDAAAGDAGGARPPAADGEFTLQLIGGGPDGPSRKQEKAFRDFLGDRDRVCSRVVDAIYNVYRCHWGDWRPTAEPGERAGEPYEAAIPELHSREGLKSLIVLDTLSVVDSPDSSAGILGFCFGCTWDPEHGLGVLVRKGRVIEIGENDITWRDFGGDVDEPPEPATEARTQVQSGIAAIKKLGGRVNDEHDEAEIDLLANDGVEDGDLAALRYFPAPAQLRVSSPRITDGALDVLQPFKTLRILELSRARITDAGMAKLSGFRSLKDLTLTWTKITDAGLNVLRKLPALTGLHLGETSVTDAGLKEIGALTGLKYLNLSGTRVTDAGIRELEGLRALLSLDLGGTAVTDAALASLSGFASLRYLTLSKCQITDTGLERLKVLTSLRSLMIASTATTDRGVAGLKQVIGGLVVVR